MTRTAAQARPGQAAQARHGSAAQGLLGRLSGELAAMAGLAARVQTAVGEALHADGAPAPAVLVELQQIDRLQQTLEDLVHVVASVAAEPEIDADGLERLAAEVRLHAVADVVTGCTANPEPQRSGTLSLF